MSANLAAWVTLEQESGLYGFPNYPDIPTSAATAKSEKYGLRISLGASARSDILSHQHCQEHFPST